MMEATRAAGAMLIPATSAERELAVAAAIVHISVSLFWTAVLVVSLPHQHIFIGSIVALALIGVLDLRVIGQLFPEIRALSFWPQFADHLAFGAVFGSVLAYSRRRRSASI